MSETSGKVNETLKFQSLIRLEVLYLNLFSSNKIVECPPDGYEG